MMRLLSILLPLVLVLAATPARSAQDDLSSLTAALVPLRTTHGTNEQRDAGPELTPVKHALRAWLERHLPPGPTEKGPDGMIDTPSQEELASLGRSLSQQLAAAGLTCGTFGKPGYRCPGDPMVADNFRGYLDDVRIGSFDFGRYLLVITGVGVRCGYDQSAYIYREGPDHAWKLLLASEQDDYGKDAYAPQNFLSIDVSPSAVAWNEAAPLPLVATLGFSPWCQSNWQQLYTRLWRASAATPTPRPLLDRADTLYIGDYQIATERLTASDFLVEYRGGSIDGGALIRSHVAHYRIQPGDTLERIAPVALGPRDFIEEWLTSDWPEAMRWSDPSANKPALATFHAAAFGKDLFGGFDGPAKRCRTDPTLWQVSFSRDGGANEPEAPADYFKVRWMAPYRFTLVDAGQRPFPGCDEEAAMPDDIGTLFPLQGRVP
ncbi:MAG: hypothetical protein JWN66_3133 [Sphingomonas bacterium]|uniref:hypothetical protein n=1 Tax=Sphingomonas bacterium TaxID=1895847 RepID=UPI002604D932|nr:hypothetical protein [Sphingomonas bacterium]MDB5706017.1 hypothetical protein [Sphingomonas bacterium]